MFIFEYNLDKILLGVYDTDIIKGAVKKQKKRLHPEKSNDAAFFVV